MSVGGEIRRVTGQDVDVGAMELRWTGDVSRGEWIAPRLGALGQVASVVPRGFPAYARVLHPVGDPAEGAATWAEVCAVTDRTMHALAQWQSISSPLAAATQMGWWPADDWFVAQSPNLF